MSTAFSTDLFISKDSNTQSLTNHYKIVLAKQLDWKRVLKSNNYEGWAGYNGAIIYSGNLGQDNKIYPDKDLGRFAFNQSDNKLYSGQVGAGLAASHGQGWSYKNIDGIKVLALVVNNALGVVYKDNKPIHIPFDAKEYFLDKIKIGKNTTIIIVFQKGFDCLSFFLLIHTCLLVVL